MATALRFRHIEAFRAIMIAGTATGAASMLHVTQPAISHLTSEMEEIVRFTLFDRLGGRLVPTATAERLFEEIERCFLGLDHINSFCDRLRESATASVRLVTVPAVALGLLPAVVRDYRQAVSPDVFVIHTHTTDIVLGWVSSQKADLGFGSKKPSLPGVVCEPVSAMDSICAIPAGHPLAGKRTITAKDLDGQPFISLSRTDGVSELVDRAFLDHGVRPKEVAECPMVAAACAMVEAGVGITLVDHFATAQFRHTNVAFRRFEPKIPIVVYAYWLANRKPHYPRSKFLDTFRRNARAMENEIEHRLGD